MILKHILERRTRVVFITLFWLLISTVAALRMGILVTRLNYILGGSKSTGLLNTVGDLHISYFTTIALVECVSAFFLLHKFNQTRQFAVKTGLFIYLMRSTEIRLSLLAVVGIMRAVTYSFQATAQSAMTIANQLDRFAYTLECMFPVMMLYVSLCSELIMEGKLTVWTGSICLRRDLSLQALAIVDHTTW